MQVDTFYLQSKILIWFLLLINKKCVFKSYISLLYNLAIFKEDS